ncbi:MAG: IS200/IS605 family transposase [Nanoarchaeota archaeon]|nr:IS200/IS605 family transposase [Nanoarchaeota archaeon]MBU1444874.1 IS200/IS605 family transposase [Nanoarchaeota archaeon]MBU2406861.1 IS200/IS605 family transposase [Nanoarchaeota archaeon]MBU2420932.1 IS200/IS605 family transposase [Nanoarchaeota archaeon]MBU2475151.1 IS200/IS605 family transposase [Nanoarchaeota archaeon]
MELKASQHGYGQNTYHLVFAPKCRYKYFMYPGIKKLCKKAFYGIAYSYNFKIHALEIQPDHVHLFVSFASSFSVSKVVQLFKGISAHRILKAFPSIRNTYLRKGHFWSAGKFYRSVGNVTADTIQHYIEQSQNGWTFEHQTKLSV